MQHEPQVEQRAAQPYVALRMPVTMEGFARAIDTGWPELFGWMEARGIAFAGAPFIRYLVIDMEAELEIELGVPVDGAVEINGRVRADVLPAGRYVTLRHVGPYGGLVASHDALQRWAREREIAFDTWETDRGSVWRCRVEHYLTNPSEEPDPSKWEVDLAYLARDDR